MIQREKRYVEVDVRFSTEGRLRPLQIIFDKGQVYKIDKIKDICRRAADVGGVGDRYTCMIQGKERELWFEDGRFRMVRHQITDGFTKFGVGFQHNLSDGNAVGIAAFIGKKDAHRTAQNSGSCTDHQCEYQNNATGSNQIYTNLEIRLRRWVA